MLETIALLTMLPMTPQDLPVSEPDPVALERTIADFSDEKAVQLWRAVNDNVMGGVSTGGPRVEAGVLVFSGETRLVNNGGFSSIRSQPRDWDLGGARELILRVRGSASRTYTMLLRTDARRWGMPVSYWQRFKLDGADWQTVRLPLPGFYPRVRGSRLSGPELDVPNIRSLGFMVYDKKAGPFRLEIDSINADWE